MAIATIDKPDYGAETRRLRARMLTLTAVIVVGFAAIASVVLWDAYARSRIRDSAVGMLVPFARHVAEIRIECAALEGQFALAIATGDPAAAAAAARSVDAIRARLEALAAVHPDESAHALALLTRFDAYATASRTLIEDVAAQRALPETLERRRIDRMRLAALLDEYLLTMRDRAQQAIEGLFVAAQAQTRQTLVSGMALFIALLTLALGTIRLVRSTVERFTHQLERQARDFSELYHDTPVMLHTSDDNGRLVSVSDFWIRQTGYERGQVLGSQQDQLFETPPLDTFGDESADADNLREYETRMRFASGHWRDVIVRSRREQDPDGRLRDLTVVVDITERRRAERELYELNQSLEQRVRERTADVSASNATLSETLQQLKNAQASLVQSEKLAALGSLVAGVAHELNTPLGNAVVTATAIEPAALELLAAVEAGRATRDGVRQQLCIIAEGAQLVTSAVGKASDLVRRFKTLAVDHASSRRRQFEVAEIVDEVALLMRAELRHHKAALEIDLQPSRQFDSFPGAMSQILTNLIQNALIHGMPEQPGAGRIAVRGRPHGDEHYRVDVHDNGRGIAAEHRPRIFEPFFTTRLGQGGSGLGLHIVFNLVTGLLGGSIDVDSSPEHGTCFRVVVPFTAPAASGALEAAALASA